MSLTQALQELTDAFRAGHLTAAEHQEMRMRVLDGHVQGVRERTL